MKKSAKVNYFYNVAYSIINMLLPLVTAPYLARILGAYGIGQYAYAFALAQYFVLIAKLGLTNYGTREISKTTNKEKKSEMFSNLFYMQIISTIIISIVYIFYIILFSGEYKEISFVFLIWIVCSFLDIDWFWFGQEEFKKVSIRNIVIKLLTVILIFLLVKNENDVILYSLIMIVGYIIGYISLWWGINKKIKFCKINFNVIKKHLLPCIIMMIPVLALNIYRSMDKVMLGAISGMEATGFYENGEKLIYCLSSLISSLGTVMMPKISYLVETNNNEKIQECISLSLKFIIILTSIMTFGLMSVSDSIIIILFGEGFSKSADILFLCAPTLLFMGWSNVFRTQYIIPYKLDHIYIKSITIGSIINLVVNFLLIPKYNAMGAVVGTLCAELFVPIYQFFKLKNKISYKKHLKSVIFYPILGIFMLIILKIIQNFLGISLLTLIIQIIIGGAVFIIFALLYIFKFDKELKKEIFKILKRKEY